MSLFENPENLLLLRNLLNPQQNQDNDSELEDGEESLVKNNLNPGNIGQQIPNSNKKSTKTKFNSPYAPLEDTSCNKKQPATIEEWQEEYQQEDDEILDTRKCPEYTMTYRQAVGTEDVFLQMGNRSNASASCEDLILDIMLSDDKTPADKMHLSITEYEVDLATPIYHLKLPFVHKVNVDRCHAKYDAELHKLTLTLRLQRELDFVNF